MISAGWSEATRKRRREEEVKPTQVRLSRVITFSAPSALQAASRLSVREISLPLVWECVRVCVCAQRRCVCDRDEMSVCVCVCVSGNKEVICISVWWSECVHRCAGTSECVYTSAYKKCIFNWKVCVCWLHRRIVWQVCERRESVCMCVCVWAAERAHSSVCVCVRKNCKRENALSKTACTWREEWVGGRRKK